MLRVALIGAGGIGKIWADGIKKTSQVFLSAVVDVHEEQAASIAKNFDNCGIFTDIREVLAMKHIDAVIIATPHFQLAPISLLALKAGKHIICEKPAGITSVELKKVWEFSRRKKLVYMTGYNHRYHPAYLMAKDLFDKGEIGKLMFIRARYGFGGRPGYEKEWRFNKKIAGGGELIDQGMHMIDMARWFMGEIKDVKGFAENMYWGGEVEDNAFLLLRTKDKKVASIHVSWTNWEWVHSFEVFGEKGYLWVDGLDKRYRGPEKITIGKFNPQLPKFPEEKIICFENEKKEDSFARELVAFASTIKGKKVGIPDGRDGYEALKIVEKIYKEKK